MSEKAKKQKKTCNRIKSRRYRWDVCLPETFSANAEFEDSVPAPRFRREVLGVKSNLEFREHPPHDVDAEPFARLGGDVPFVCDGMMCPGHLLLQPFGLANKQYIGPCTSTAIQVYLK